MNEKKSWKWCDNYIWVFVGLDPLFVGFWRMEIADFPKMNDFN